MKYSTLSIELHYLPSIEYFVYLSSFEKVFIDLNDRYVKQTYRNRCRINGANNIENLIIPIKKDSKKIRFTRNVEIDYGQKWLSKHMRAIQSAYGKAPFFEYFADEFFAIYNKKPNRLLELNKELLTKCLEILELSVNIQFTEKINPNDKNGLFEASNSIKAKNSIDKNSLFDPVSYFQVFGKNFVNNLSIIDLIFCEGPQARQILEKSQAKNNQI